MKYNKLLILKAQVNRRTMRFIKDRHKWLFTLLLASGLALCATHALAVVYQWQDADGSMVYSQLPPGDGRPVREVSPPPPPATRPEQAEQELEQLRQRARQRIEQRQRARDKDIAERAARKTARPHAKTCARSSRENAC